MRDGTRASHLSARPLCIGKTRSSTRLVEGHFKNMVPRYGPIFDPEDIAMRFCVGMLGRSSNRFPKAYHQASGQSRPFLLDPSGLAPNPRAPQANVLGLAERRRTLTHPRRTQT